MVIVNIWHSKFRIRRIKNNGQKKELIIVALGPETLNRQVYIKYL